jgi:plastocyanin
MTRFLTLAALAILGACERSGGPPAPASKAIDAATTATVATPTASAAPAGGFDESLLGAAPPGAIAGQVLDGAQHAAAGVIVYVKEGPAKSHYPPPAQAAVIDQRDKAFVPRILAVLAGTKVAFKNSDVVLHNVYSRSHTKTFDLGAYPHDESRSALFDEPGRVDVFCAIHTNMHAVILVLENPYFATTDARGYFEIRGVSPGSHTVGVWSEQSDEQEIHVEIAGDRPSIVRHGLP